LSVWVILIVWTPIHPEEVILACGRPVMMLWTAPPPARKCH
jgi:hypothetical protein